MNATETAAIELDLDAIEARVNATTEGPWVAHSDGLVWTEKPLPGDPVSGSTEIEDAEFIAHARTDVPALVAEVRRLRARLEQPCGSCHPCDNYADETWRKANRKPPHVVTWDDTRDAMARVAHLANQYEVAGDAATAQRIRKALHIPTLDELLDEADVPA